MSAAPRTIIVVGAGFCGTMLAVNLLRLARDQPVRIILIERAQFARGLAYSRLQYPYLLNVPAGRMSADPGEPEQFLEFARDSHPDARASDFLPRGIYGDYLEALLRTAENTATPAAAVQRVLGTVIALERAHRNSGFHVHLADGRSIDGDAVVLATGNPAPAAVPGVERLRGSARYVADPWQAPPRFRSGESVLVIGTGLTMADVVLAGTAGNPRGIRITAISRRGLMPATQAPPSAESVKELLPRPEEAAASLLHVSREARRMARELARRGEDWRRIITRIREIAPQLWQHMSPAARRRFVTHLRPYWDVHRHRLPGGTAATLRELQRDGRLQVCAGRILGFEPAGKLVEASYRPRGQLQPTSLRVDRVINCTGPNYDVTQTSERMLRGLLAQRLATPDPLHLGLATDDIGRLIGTGGTACPDLYYIGPLLRARDWESTAVTELRSQVQRLARHLLQARPAAAAGLVTAPLLRAATPAGLGNSNTSVPAHRGSRDFRLL